MIELKNLKQGKLITNLILIYDKMKKIFLIMITILYGGCKNITPEPIIKYVPVKDSIEAIQIINLTEELRRTRDSLNAYKRDTAMTEELFIAKFKLEKIKYYNEIAAKGNNIKFLRGWINRTLEE